MRRYLLDTNSASDCIFRRRGVLFAELRRTGRPMQVVDMMIAAIAFSLGNCTVVSADSDLAAVPGLMVENWAS